MMELLVKRLVFETLPVSLQLPMRKAVEQQVFRILKVGMVQMCQERLNIVMRVVEVVELGHYS